jgi:peptide/nickel transport system substrate-binding protein
MSLKRAVAALCVVASLCTVVAAGTAGAASNKPKSGGQITWLLSSEAPAFETKNTHAATTYGPELMAVYGELVHVDPATGKVTPGFATVTGNANSTVWTIKLRPNLKFTDGTPFDADAIRVNWDRLKDPATAAVSRTIVAGFTSYVVTDPLTLKVTLPEGRGSFPTYLGGHTGQIGLIASPAALAKCGKSYGSTPDCTVGAGPFVLKQYVVGGTTVVTKNADYYDKPRPYLDQITFRSVSDTAQKANAMVAGQGDVAFMPTPNTDTATLASAGFKSNGVPQAASITVIFNLSKAPYDDPRVRQALTLAVDQNDVNQKAQAGQATPTDTWFPKESPFYDASLKVKTNNLTQAQKLIDQYVAEKGPVKGTLMFSQSLAVLGSVIMQQWARLKNVEIQADQLPSGVSSVNLVQGNYAAALSATPNITTIEDAYQPWFTGLSTNAQKISDPKVDQNLTEGRKYVDIEKQKEYVIPIVKAIIADYAYIPLYRNQNQEFTSKKISGIKQQTFSHIDPAYLQLKS